MNIQLRLVLAATLAISVAACNKSDGGGSTGTSSAKPGGASPTSSGAFGPDSVAVEWTGKFVDGEGEKQVPTYKVTNKTDKDVYYMKVWYYFYDASKKQIGRAFFERYSLNLKPGESKEMPLGNGKDKMVKGDVKSIQAVVVGATYAGNGKWDGDVKALASEQRPMK